MYHSEPIRSTDTVFLGDSLTESFDLQKHFGSNSYRNRGMSGNMTEHVLYRLEEITNSKPARLFLMIGINDIYQGISQHKTLNNIEKIIDDLIQKSPETKLFVQSILPVNAEKLLITNSIHISIYKINDQLRNVCKEKGISFVDIHPDFLNDNGEMDSKFTYDGVHLTEQGYIHWAELLQNYL